MNDAVLIPVTDDPDTRGFWEAAARGLLAVQRCSACSAPIHLPKACCGSCGSWESNWVEVSPRGTLYTWTTVERTVRASFPAPYTLIVVDLDDAPGVRLLGQLPGRPELAAGARVSATFEVIGDAVLPMWHLDVGQNATVSDG
jgi:uncharacterized OB-fold protein